MISARSKKYMFEVGGDNYVPNLTFVESCYSCLLDLEKRIQQFRRQK